MKRILIIPILFLWINAQSQAPGGVKNPVLWQKDWEANSQEDYGSAKFNFYSYQFFDEDRGYNETKLIDLKKTTMFIVFSSEKESEVGRFDIGTKQIVLTDSTLTLDRKIAYKETNAFPKIITFQKSFHGQDQSKDDTSHFIFGSKTIEDNWFEGGIAEVIIYDRLLSKKQIKKVESYLAIKYGIPLEQSMSYIQSDGVLIWDPEKQGDFTHRLTGIGGDVASGLNHHQSHNLYCDLGLTISSGPVEQMNKNHTKKIQDKSFLLWADNNNTLNFSNESFKELDIDILERSWKVTATDDNWLGKEVTIKMT